MNKVKTCTPHGLIQQHIVELW